MKNEYARKLFDGALWLVWIGVGLLYCLLAVDHVAHLYGHAWRVRDDRARAEERRQRHREADVRRRNEAVLAKTERVHQVFCDETCRVALMTPMQHDHVWEEGDDGQMRSTRLCRCYRDSPDGRFRQIETWTKSYSPLIDRENR